MLVVIDLGRFQFDFVNANLLGEAVDFGDLVLVRADHEKLEDDVRRLRFQFFFPFHHIPCALQNHLQLALFAVALISVLRRAINGDDEAVEARFDGAAGVFIVEKMAVRAGDGVNAPLPCVTHHVEELGVDVRLALEIEDEIEQLSVQFVNRFPEKILLQIARWSGEGPQPAGAFRAAEIAGSGGFQRDGHRHSPLHGLFHDFGELVGNIDFGHVPYSAQCELAEEIAGIVAIKLHVEA